MGFNLQRFKGSCFWMRVYAPNCTSFSSVFRTLHVIWFQLFESCLSRPHLLPKCFYTGAEKFEDFTCCDLGSVEKVSCMHTDFSVNIQRGQNWRVIGKDRSCKYWLNIKQQAHFSVKQGRGNESREITAFGWAHTGKQTEETSHGKNSRTFVTL